MSTTTKIAKNTLLLYFRQILIMLVSLYTVRVVLNTLGETDYGIYNVVAGVVVLFTFINSALATASQRFFSFSLGKNDKVGLQNYFSLSFFIIFIFIALITIFAEAGGTWFILKKMNVPEERRRVALIVLQFSVIATAFNSLRIPYNAMIISYEKMSFFAWISILESVLKLGTAFILKIISFDKLISYSVLIALVSVIIFLCYLFYSLRNFKECKLKRFYDKKALKELVGFSGWSLLGGCANMANSQGINMIVNVFCGVVVNAAMGIANQVDTAVYSFVTNFQTAFNPQIVKSYAAGEYESLSTLINRTAKCSYYLLLFIVVPLYVNLEFILTLWLGNIPDYTLGFIKLNLILSLVSAINGPLWMTVQARGNIRNYQIIVSIIIIANLPLAYIALKLGANAYSVIIIKIIMQIVVTVFRLIYMHNYMNLNLKRFTKEVFIPMIPITVVSLSLAYLVKQMINNTILSFFISCICAVVVVATLVYFFGINKQERDMLKNFIKLKINFQPNRENKMNY